jgi:HSP20 family protein
MGRKITRRAEDDAQPLGEQVDDFFDRVLGLASGLRYQLRHNWHPLVDVYEIETGIMVVAELPGVDEAALDVSVHNNRLRIAGTRLQPNIEQCRQPLQLEIEYGPFERIIALPGHVDSEGVRAHFRHGLLAVHVPLVQVKRSVPVQADDE